MKFLVVLAVAVACASADVAKDESSAAVVRTKSEIYPDGGFQFLYETGNGIYAQAAGALKNANSEYPALEVSGGYKYTSPEGEPVEVSYTADEEGFKPVGSHLPVSPPIPELIARGLAYIAAHPPPPAKA